MMRKKLEEEKANAKAEAAQESIPPAIEGVVHGS